LPLRGVLSATLWGRLTLLGVLSATLRVLTAPWWRWLTTLSALRRITV